MYLQVSQLNKSYNTKTVVHDVALQMEQGEILALLGPSGCGKTTILRMLAGLITPDSGRIQVGDSIFFGAGREVPAEDRQIGMVFQDLALWPHMTVADNIAFGLRLRRQPANEIAQRVEAMLDLVNLPGIGGRYPYQLSGGQQQRVAVARALATEPRLILMDEPLSSLDAGLRENMRNDLVLLFHRLKITVINVTHDQDEAMAMSDRILVLREGVVQQTGTPTDLYLRPANRFVASFMGPANILPGEIVAAPSGVAAGPRDAVAMVLDDGQPEKKRVTGQLNHNLRRQTGGRAWLVFRPEDVRVYADAAHLEQTNALEGTVWQTSFVGGQWRTWVRFDRLGSAQVLAFPAFQPQIGQRLWLELAPERCQVLPE